MTLPAVGHTGNTLNSLRWAGMALLYAVGCTTGDAGPGRPSTPVEAPSVGVGDGHAGDAGPAGEPGMFDGADAGPPGKPGMFWVATHGDDAGEGTAEHPFRTLARARDAVAALRSAHGLP